MAEKCCLSLRMRLNLNAPSGWQFLPQLVVLSNSAKSLLTLFRSRVLFRLQSSRWRMVGLFEHKRRQEVSYVVLIINIGWLGIG